MKAILAPSTAALRPDSAHEYANLIRDFDAIVVGAGPAGATIAIRLAAAGWSVALVEKRPFPRRKVCGECIAASNLPLLDALGVGDAFRDIAGPELRRVGLFVGARRIRAPLPPLEDGSSRWGRALGREHLDTMLVARARQLGAHVWQPWTVQRETRDGDRHLCVLSQPGSDDDAVLQAPVLIHAQGSWEPEPKRDANIDYTDAAALTRLPHRDGDLLAFKGTYRNARIEPGLLPVLAFPGGYGGMVLGDHGLTTLAFCIRRDALQALRTRRPGRKAALAALAHVRAACTGVDEALADAEPVDRWLAVGPLQPGIRTPWRDDGSFAVGNAAGEAHPILGEGISMALQSAWLLGNLLVAQQERLHAGGDVRALLQDIGRDYARNWHGHFAPRIRFAAICAHLAMRPRAAAALLPLLQRWPTLLTQGARVAGKVRHVAVDTLTTTAQPATGAHG